MARTYRKKVYHWLRRPKTTNSRRGEHVTVLDLLEEGCQVSNRHKVRGNLSSKKIPMSWDDLIISALREKWNLGYRLTWGCCVLCNERGSGRDV